MGHHEAVSPPPPRQLRAGAIPLLVVSHEVLRGGVADTVLTGPDPRSGSLCLLPQRLLLRFEAFMRLKECISCLITKQ